MKIEKSKSSFQNHGKPEFDSNSDKINASSFKSYYAKQGMKQVVDLHKKVSKQEPWKPRRKAVTGRAGRSSTRSFSKLVSTVNATGRHW